jgi:hypothetical protein
MEKNFENSPASLQWKIGFGAGEGAEPSRPQPHRSDEQASDIEKRTFSEVVDSIGKDCTQLVEPYLERCLTRQEGE